MSASTTTSEAQPITTTTKPLQNLQTTYSNGIYHGLPADFPANPGPHSAIVCGANGISGQAMLKILAEHPDRWPEVWSLSRSGRGEEKEEEEKQVRNMQMDFLHKEGAEGIAKVLKQGGVQAEVVFWFAYLDGKDDDNVNMLKSFIEGCALANLKFKRLILQTGGKHYGVHQGPYKVPAREDDPRVDLGPNFYYRQEDLLAELGPKYGFDYVIVRPMTIIGAVKGNFLNLAMALGLYLAVTKELGDTPIFNGSFEKYHSVEALSSATMNSYFEEWCALTPTCANQAFNITNGDTSVWARLWPTCCSHFGLHALDDDQEQFPSSPTTTTTTTTQPPSRYPLHGVFPTPPPLSPHSPPATWSLTNSLQLWSREARTLSAWRSLATREGLQHDAFERASWGYADRNMAIGYDKLEDVGKARRYGWLGYVDSGEQLLETFGRGAEVGILPRGVGVGEGDGA